MPNLLPLVTILAIVFGAYFMAHLVLTGLYHLRAKTKGSSPRAVRPRVQPR
jgi:uncharacterized membrane protein YciS (DUF1049 family)